MSSNTLPMLTAFLGDHGLTLLGQVHFQAGEDVNGEHFASALLIGSIGSALWPAFRQEGTLQSSNPLDDWTRRILTPLAADLDASVVFPFEGPPYWPFQTWARRTGQFHASPIGPLIHRDWGLWFAFRGALLMKNPLAFDPPGPSLSPCESCANRPCLSTCPVNALTDGAYDVPACSRHLQSPSGQDCLTQSCAARRACPVGQEHRYDPAHARFHMDKFIENFGEGR